MITNKEIHNLAEVAYAKIRVKAHRVGYSVRWEVRRAADSSYVITHGSVETDFAGYMAKADAYRLGNRLVKEGYTGVCIIRATNVDNVRKCSDEILEYLSAEYQPEVL